MLQILINSLFKLNASIYQDAGLPDSDSSNLVNNIKNLVFVAAGVIALFVLVIAGFKYVTSGGNPENTKKAGQTIIFASLGLFLILTSYVIMTWVFKVGG